MVFQSMESFQNYHRNYLPKNFESKLGIEAKNEDDNNKILSEHLHHHFDCHIQIDPTVLDKLQQHQVAHKLGNPPTINEVKSAITSIAFDKAPGESE